MTQPLRWGILGTGTIAHTFASQLGETSRAELVAAASRKVETANTFAAEFGCSAHASYEELLANESVEAIYVSLPNSLHHPWTMRAIAAGKHVLCEKPIASNSAQAEEMFAAAQKADRVLVEGFMYRSHPAILHMLDLIRGGTIGQVKIIRSHFTFNLPPSKDEICYRADLAGGSLMDIGCYPINFTRAIVGAEPNRIHAVGELHSGGVDEYVSAVLGFENGVLATLSCGMTVESDCTTFIAGSEGYLEIPMPWLYDGRYTIVDREGKRQSHRIEAPRGVYALEAEAFAASVRDGQNPLITKEDTLGNMRVLDELRKQVGMTY